MLQGIVSRTCSRMRPLLHRFRPTSSTRGYSNKRNVPTVIPRSFGGLWDDMFHFPVSRQLREIDNHFEDAWRNMERMMLYNFPELSARAYRDAGARVSIDDTHFEIQIDVRHFDPSEVNVKLAGNRLTVSGKHETKDDQHGTVKREFEREFILPESVDTDSLTSTLSKDGVLTLNAKVKVAEKEPDKVIEIKREPAGENSK